MDRRIEIDIQIYRWIENKTNKKKKKKKKKKKEESEESTKGGFRI